MIPEIEQIMKDMDNILHNFNPDLRPTFQDVIDNMDKIIDKLQNSFQDPDKQEFKLEEIKKIEQSQLKSEEFKTCVSESDLEASELDSFEVIPIKTSKTSKTSKTPSTSHEADLIKEPCTKHLESAKHKKFEMKKNELETCETDDTNIRKRNKQIKKEEKLKFQVEYHEEVDDEDKQIEEEIKRLRNIVLNNK